MLCMYIYIYIYIHNINNEVSKCCSSSCHAVNVLSNREVSVVNIGTELQVGDDIVRTYYHLNRI